MAVSSIVSEKETDFLGAVFRVCWTLASPTMDDATSPPPVVLATLLATATYALCLVRWVLRAAPEAA